ncbi:hypothetical protein HJFPF1_06871 [Paramyrothecium foliicola]|nr:hypothetical protein HJFPF1_06871 [Paramyrothecium foliicola]
MSKYINKLLNGASALSGDGSTTHHFILRPAPKDSHLTLVQTVAQAPGQPPVYTVRDDGSTKTLYVGGPHQPNFVGDMSESTMGMTQRLSLRGHQLTVRTSKSDTKYIVESQQYGRLEWKPNSLGLGLYLHDQNGNKVAAYKSNGLKNLGEKQVLVFVPCDGYYLEMIVLTAIAAKQLDRNVEEVVGEIAGAV